MDHYEGRHPHIVSGNRGGSITLISSIAGLKGLAYRGPYAAAKHGVVGLMRTLATVWRSTFV